MNNLISLLNREQYESVTKIDGANLILAGAGSGKTRVITYKIVYLISQGVKPNDILSVTFTNKAAKEMQERVNELLPKNSKGVLLTTFHSLGLRILKEQITKIGYKDKFSIYDEKDVQKILKDILSELKIAEDKYDLYNLTFQMSLAKMNLESKMDDEEIKRSILNIKSI